MLRTVDARREATGFGVMHVHEMNLAGGQIAADEGSQVDTFHYVGVHHHSLCIECPN